MSIEALIEAIHASPVRLSLCICGAGAGVVRRLTRVAECSRTLLEANVLYHRGSTQTALDGLPRHIVSAEAARQLAQHAFHASRAIALAEAQQQQTPVGQLAARIPGLPTDLLFGIGATSAVKTSRTRHSTDRVHVCVWGGSVSTSCGVSPLVASSHHASASAALPPLGQVRDYHLEMPAWMSRAEQDEQVELMVLHAIACTVDACLPTNTELSSGSGGGSSSGNRRTFPRAALQTLLPSPGEDQVRSGGASESSSSPGLSMMADTARLCAVPAVSLPVPVCLDAASEVQRALTHVLEPPSAGAADVCVLWNRHGELRTGGMEPYADDARVAASDVGREEPRAAGENPLMEDATVDEGTVPLSADAAAAPPASAAAAEAVKGIRLLYPGSFNPLHYGHTELVHAATRVLLEQHHLQNLEGGALPPPVEVTYEIAVKVVDKGAIAVDDLERRVCQFLRRGERVAVTAATLFVAKARLFPGHGFLIGIDTAARVLEAKHYSTSTDPAAAESAMVDALTRDIGGRGCYFVVGGRKLSDAAGWQDLSALRIPDRIRHLFVSIPETEFRVDVSSTELRALRQGRGA